MSKAKKKSKRKATEIKITIKSEEPFDPDTLMDWLNDEFDMANMSTGEAMEATDYEIMKK